MHTRVKIGLTAALVIIAISLASTSTVNAFMYESYLEVVGGPVLNPLAMQFSPPGDFVAEIVDCGLGYPADFPPGVVGKIALILRGELYFWEKTQNAAAAGALAAIIYNNEPGNLDFGTLTFITDIPAVGISDVEGGLLLTLLASGPVTVHLRVGPYLAEPTVDIKPGVWPNTINIASSEVFDVAMCGHGAFDVMTIDPATVRMYRLVAEVYPWGWRYEDVATPYIGNMPGGHAAGPDGYMDLVLEFDTPTVVATFELADYVGVTLSLGVGGFLYEIYDGTYVSYSDYVQIIELTPGIPEFSFTVPLVTSLAAALYLALRKRIEKKLE